MTYYLDPFVLITRANDRINFVGAGAENIRSYVFDEAQQKQLSLLLQGQPLSEEQLVDSFSAKTVEEWKKQGWLTAQCLDTVTIDSRTEAFYRAYGMQDAGQQLRKKSVLILGCGGIGTHMAWHMILLGVGRLTLLDFDTVEQSNLNRQLLFDLEDVGKCKVEVLRQKLLRIRPDADIRAVTKQISCEEELDAVCSADKYDLVIKALDTPAQFPVWLDAVCRRRGLAYTTGITLQKKTLIGPTFVPKKSEVGLSDILPSAPSEKLHGTAPSLGILLYHISDALAVESFRLLTGCGKLQYCGRIVAENLFEGTVEEFGPAATEKSPAITKNSAILSTAATAFFAAVGLFHWTGFLFGFLFLLLAPLLQRSEKGIAVKQTFYNAALFGITGFLRIAVALPHSAWGLRAVLLAASFSAISICLLLFCVLSLLLRNCLEKRKK